jgi:FHS family glucose/mannose:H+ symporter-like MFS transporter
VTPRAKKTLFVAACAGLFLFGVVLALLGALLAWPAVLTRLAIDPSRQADLFLLLYFGLFVGTIGGGPAIDRVGNRRVLFASALMVTLSLAGFAYGRGFVVAGATSVLLGVGGAGLNVACNALVADIYGDARGPMLNLLGVSFGVGALFIPLFAASGLALFAIDNLLLFAIALSVLCTLVYAFTPFPPARDAHGLSLVEISRRLRDPVVVLFALILFCQSGQEASIGGWTASLVSSMGKGPRTAVSVLSCYWAALMTGRLASARLLDRAPKHRIVLGSAMGSAVGSAVLMSATSLSTLTLGVVIVGLSHAAVFPTALAMAAERYPSSTGTVFGVLIAIALVGGMTCPWTVGRIAAASQVRYAMALPLTGAVMICFLITAVHLRRGGLDTWRSRRMPAQRTIPTDVD